MRKVILLFGLCVIAHLCCANTPVIPDNSTLQLDNITVSPDIIEGKISFCLLESKDTLLVASYSQWQDIYIELNNGSESGMIFPEIDSTANLIQKKYLDKNIIPICIINSRFLSFTENALTNNLIIDDSNNIVIAGGSSDSSLIKEYSIFAATFPFKEINPGIYNFIFTPELYFSNCYSEIDYLLVDFGNGSGEQVVYPNKYYSVHYYAKGLFNISVTPVFKINEYNRLKRQIQQIASGNIFVVESIALSVPENNYYFRTTSEITDFNYNNTNNPNDSHDKFGRAEVGIWLAEGEGKGMEYFDKPLIIVDGFDPAPQKRGINEIYLMAKEWNNTIDSLKNKCYDIVVVNWINGGDWIQKNAFALVEVLNQINKLKIGCNPNILFGPSMGGIIGRYALCYMEKHGIDHQVETFITDDSPHRGANIPIGIQTMVDFYKNQSSEAQASYNKLTCPASRQMLIYNIYNSNPFSTDIMKQNLYNELKTMNDFPEKPKLIAIVSGSGIGKPQHNETGLCMYPESLIFKISGSLLTKKFMESKIWALKPGGVYFDGWYFKLTLSRLWKCVLGGNNGNGCRIDLAIDKVRRSETAPNTALAIDNAPGGYYPFFKEDVNGIKAPFGTTSKSLIFPYVCFIPTISALALEESTNLNYANPRKEQTPFDEIIYTTIPQSGEEMDIPGNFSYNEEHCWITREKQNFVFEKIGTGLYDDLNITNKVFFSPAISHNVYIQADNSITTHNNVIVSKGNSVSFYAGNKIIFNPGFRIEEGAEVNAGTNMPEKPCNTCFSKFGTTTNHVEEVEFYVKDTFHLPINTSIDNPTHEDESITVWPNPSNGRFNISLPPSEEIYDISIINMSGTTILRIQQISGISATVDISDKNRGIYILKVVGKNNTYITKLLYH